jgi:hypothetical protein
MSVAYPSIQHRVSASGSRRARPRWAMTPSAPIDERYGITSQARNQPLASFWILFRPGLGYYCPDGEARKAAVFLRSDFHREIESISLQRRVHCEPDFQQPTTFKLKATTSAARRNHPGLMFVGRIDPIEFAQQSRPFEFGWFTAAAGGTIRGGVRDR